MATDDFMKMCDRVLRKAELRVGRRLFPVSAPTLRLEQTGPADTDDADNGALSDGTFIPKDDGSAPVSADLDLMRPEHHGTKKPTVLLVDDEEIISKSLSFLLREQGYEVITSNSGEIAIQMLSSCKFDVLVSEIMMSGLNGFQLAARARSFNPTVAVLFIAGLPFETFLYHSMGTRPPELQSGYAYFLEKPFLFKEIESAILRCAADSQGLTTDPDRSLFRACWLEKATDQPHLFRVTEGLSMAPILTQAIQNRGLRTHRSSTAKTE